MTLAHSSGVVERKTSCIAMGRSVGIVPTLKEKETPMKRSIGLRTAQVLVTSTVVVALTALTACSSDDSGSDDTATSSAEAPSDAFPGKAATGDPVKIGFISAEGGAAISQPEVREAGEAVTKYANENLGGIGGRPIELVICKQQEEPVSARDCANQMVQQKVSAVVVPVAGLGNLIAPIVTEAGIPYVSAQGASIPELTTEGAYSITAASNSSQAMAAYAAENGIKKVTAFSIDVPAAVGALQTVGVPAFEANGAELKIVPIPLGTPDATPQVSAGLDDDPEAVVIFGDSTVCTSVIKALTTLGSTAEKWTAISCSAPEVIDAVGAGSDDTKVFTSAATVGDNPETTLYREVLEKYSPETPTESNAVVGYQAMLGLVRATQSVVATDTSPTALNQAIKTAKDVPTPAGNGLTFTCDGTQIAGVPAVCSNGLIILTMKDGKQTDPTNVEIK